MKITLSKSQWEFIGKKTGWIKAAESNTPIVNSIIEPRNEEEKNNNINILRQQVKKAIDEELYDWQIARIDNNGKIDIE